MNDVVLKEGRKVMVRFKYFGPAAYLEGFCSGELWGPVNRVCMRTRRDFGIRAAKNDSRTRREKPGRKVVAENKYENF